MQPKIDLKVELRHRFTVTDIKGAGRLRRASVTIRDEDGTHRTIHEGDDVIVILNHTHTQEG